MVKLSWPSLLPSGRMDRRCCRLRGPCRPARRW
jgi:hypothetical protein